ncbi:MAG: hypothetical protein Tsb0018_07580 [Opitutales bacterium]|tara:strand:- start:2660 stop:3172 length:513 start_codon:yes stop_codon:yes gene_type:complete
MKHYNYQEQLRHLWKHAVTLCKAEEQDLAAYFSADETSFLQSIGMLPHEMYDFAEDYVEVGEPDFTTMALIQHVRRGYFLREQQGMPSQQVISASDIPSGEDTIDGVDWLPRITHKALAKLRGELDPDLMFNCGRDRKFFKDHDVHPADFLLWVWDLGADTKRLVECLQP